LAEGDKRDTIRTRKTIKDLCEPGNNESWVAHVITVAAGRDNPEGGEGLAIEHLLKSFQRQGAYLRKFRWIPPPLYERPRIHAKNKSGRLLSKPAAVF
jgi:hypothetical protein